MAVKIPISCNKDCGGGCALSAHLENGRIRKITDSSFRPEYMRGCIKGYRMADALYHPERLKRPLLRKGERGSGTYKEISWDDALDLLAEKLFSFKDSYGPQSVMRIGGSGSCRGALHNTAVLTQRFLSLYGGYTETTGNFSSEASDFVKPFMFGTKYVGIDVKTLFESNLVILWGMNPEETRMGSETEEVLSAAAAKGVSIVVIDPRKTASVRRYRAKWFPVLPGTDSALMLALLFVLIRDLRIDEEYILRYSTGFNGLRDYVTGILDGVPKDPLWAERICGLPASRIEELAGMYCEAKPAALLSGLSVQRTIGGENTDRLGAILQLATGNFGIPGGSPGCGQWNKIPPPRCGSMKVPTNPEVRTVPVYRWADAVLEGTAGGYPSDIRMLYNVGGNYLGQGSDLGKVQAAFHKVDFVVSHEYFMTPTASFSDLVLPVATFLERNDIVFSNSKYLFYSAKAAEPVGESKSDYEIFSRLSRRLGYWEAFTESRTEEQWLDYFLDNSEVEDRAAFKKTGIYAAEEQSYIGLSGFFKDPEADPLNTPSGKIEIALGSFPAMGGTELPEAVVMDVSSRYPLRLFTPHEKYRIHSQFDNIEGFRRLTDRFLWINPDDAAERGIKDGQTVTVTSETGEIRVTARVTENIISGAVSLNQGGWVQWKREAAGSFFDRKTDNPNFLTSTEPTKPSSGSRTHSTAVQVETTIDKMYK